METSQTLSVFKPVGRSARISSVDTLRGVALLGILLMNIIDFGMPGKAYDNPMAFGGHTGANLYFWLVNSVLFEGKMRAIFSMLFGAGMILLTGKKENANPELSAADIYYRRVIWLVLFGVIDAYVILWDGDILFWYGMCGLFLFPFRKMQPRYLLLIGLLCLGILITKDYFSRAGKLETYHLAQRADVLQKQKKPLTDELKKAQEKWLLIQKNYMGDKKEFDEDIKKHRGGYIDNFRVRMALNIPSQSTVLYLYCWDVSGMMFIGMALMKWGVFAAKLKKRQYLVMLLLGYGIGIPINYYVAHTRASLNFDMVKIAQALPFSTYDVTRLTVAFGHIGLVMLVVKLGYFKWLTRALAAVGQMALTNYISHAVICAILFSGFGFGIYGQLQRYQLYYVVGGIWLFQLIICPIWLSYFQFGPLEWAWRSLTYWQRQPMLAAKPTEPEQTEAIPAYT